MSDLNLVLGDLTTSNFGEKYYKEVNHLTFEKQTSQQLFDRHFGDSFSTEDMLYLVVGTDSGLLYNYIKSLPQPKNTHYIFVDFQDVYQGLGLTGKQEELWEGSYRLVGQDFDFSRLDDEFHGYLLRKKVEVIKSVAVSDASSESVYFDLWKRVELDFLAFMRAVMNFSKAKDFEIQRLMNSVDNIIPSATLAETLVGRDALILGGGPSLNTAIDWIKENQDKFIIFAAGRVSKRLLQEGLNPDFIVTVDPRWISYQNAKELLLFAESSILINAFHAINTLVGQWSGLAVYTGSRYAWQTDNQVANLDVAGPTVTNSALHQAFGYGAKRIFLIGLDFCFYGGQTHEASSHEAQAGNILRQRNLKKVLNNAGELAETTDDYYMAMQAMEENIATYKSLRDIEFISLGKTSAKMQQVEYQEFSEVVLDEFDKNLLVSKIKGVLHEVESKRLDLAEANFAELRKQLRRFNSLIDLAQKGLRDAPKIYDSKTHQIKAKPAERVQKVRRKINNLIGPDGDMFLNFDARNFADSFKNIADEENMTNEEVTEQLVAFFNGVETASQEFKDFVEKAIVRTELRVDELEGRVLPSQLIEEWERIKQFGRVYSWEKWHKDKLESLDAKELEVIAEAKEKALENFEDIDTRRINYIKKKTSEVGVLLPRAEFAFETKNLAELNLVIEHSDQLAADEQNQKASFIGYLKAMQAELQEDYVLAEELYRSVSFPFLQQKALKRLLSFKMQQEDFDTSLVLLENLCQFSLEYMLPYSDLLATLGNKEMALEVIKMYLGQHPENFDVHVKMAQLQFDLGMAEDALDRVKAVLEMQPDNSAAKVLIERFRQS